MGAFLIAEKRRYIEGKADAVWLSAAAKRPGVYKGKEYAFCLPEQNAEENLFVGIREEVLEYFRDKAIKWHDGTERGPSNHLCSSMVCGVNFLGALMNDPDGATCLLQTVFGSGVARAVPVADSRLVEFEWVGSPDHDYIHEGLNRTRGANATSADAAMAYERPDGGTTLVLIEWKYTESYSPQDKGAGPQGVTRRARYEGLLADPEGPIDSSLVSYEETLFEPFYQFMRQQLLAWRMQVEQSEGGADQVRVLHLSPRANRDFERVTSPALLKRYPGAKATALWRSVLRTPEAFTAVAVEDAFAPLLEGDSVALAPWREYIAARYPW